MTDVKCSLCNIRTPALHKNRKVPTFTKYCDECRERLSSHGMSNEEKQAWMIKRIERENDDLQELQVATSAFANSFKAIRNKLNKHQRKLTAKNCKYNFQLQDETCEWIFKSRKASVNLLKQALTNLDKALHDIRHLDEDCPIPDV